MPYYTLEEGYQEEEDSVREGEPDYDPVEDRRFNPDNLDGTAALAFAQLEELDVSTIRCRIYGGSDEGFAAFGEAIIEGETLSAELLAERLASGPLGNIPDDPWIFSGPEPDSYFSTLTRAERAQESLDHLAFVLATRLLGDGYGTGDYSMHGAFTADLNTCTLSDEEELRDNEKE